MKKTIKKIKKTIKRNLIFILAVILYCNAVFAALSWDEIYDGMTINVTEGVRFIYIVNVTGNPDADYPILFSDDSEVKLPIFNMVAFNGSDNNRRAIINFTPAESDVLDANGNPDNYHITIIAKNQSAMGTIVADILFNITNANDPPNITSFTPAGMEVEENSTITFSFDNDTADPDLTHPGEDSITNIWYLNGTNRSINVSWSYSPGFCNSSTYNISLRVNDSYKNSTQITQILTVTNLNRPPVNNATIGNLTWQEDNNLTNNFTLIGFFNDSDKRECTGSNKDTLTYGYTSYSVTDSINSSKSINVSIDQTTGNVSFYVPSNWYGIEIIAFYATDGYNTTYSNNVTLNVTNINDAPVLEQINNQSLKVGTLFTMQINATDPDNDPLYFYTNSSIITINTTTGIINFTPEEANIGDHMVNITVNDSLLMGSKIINFSIRNNTEPVLDPIGDQNATKGILFSLNLAATDADGDNLTFTSNSTLFDITWYNETMSQISFTPSLSDIGNHSIEFTVTDTGGATDSEIIILSINDSNRAPVLNTSINNITWSHDTNLTNNITLSDYFHDPDADNLIYNVTGNVNITIVINQTTANVSFQPDTGWSGVEYIRFYANDSYYRTYSNNITLNVTPNNAPVLNISINNITWRQGTNLTNNITLSDYFYDPDGDNLTYNVTGNVNITITINSTTLNVSFYPDLTWSGIEYIKFYANDSYNITYSNNITLNVTPNNAPVINNIYPYGNWTTTIYNWTIPSLYPSGVNISINENTTETFKQNTSDADGDSLTYQWLLNGSLVNTTQNLTYYFNFSTAGSRNLTVKVTDGMNTTSFYWNINITNINRPPRFGIKTYTSQSDFSGGTLTNVNITEQPGNITLNQSGGGYINGTYISPSIDVGAEDDKLNFTYISWTSNLPTRTNITLKTRTASSSAGLSSSNWSNPYTNSTRSQITSTNNQYIQFMANLTTKDNTETPTLQGVNINYKIATPALLEDYVYENWIDLDDYFEDLDADDTLKFNNSDITNLIIVIDPDDQTVRLSFTSNWFGSETVQFNANDSYTTTYSNNITIVVQDVVDDISTTTTIISSGGGGGGARRTVVKKVKEYEYVTLLTPGPISVIGPNKVKIPIILENNIDEPLKEVYLSATTEEGVSLEFDISFIDEIDLKGKKTVNLFATAMDKSEPYIIYINAKVTTPALNDSTIVQINPLENMTVKIKSVMDLLKSKPECLELNELVINARKAIDNKEYVKANNLLDEAIRSCRFIQAKEKEKETEEKPSPKFDILIWAILALIIFAAALSFYLTRNKKPKHPKNKKKEAK